MRRAVLPLPPYFNGTQSDPRRRMKGEVGPTSVGPQYAVLLLRPAACPAAIGCHRRLLHPPPAHPAPPSHAGAPKRVLPSSTNSFALAQKWVRVGWASPLFALLPYSFCELWG